MAQTRRSASNVAAGGFEPYARWFQLLDPGLLTNRAIRNFLSTYREDDWPLAVKLVVLHGISTLRKQYGARILSIRELKAVVGQGNAAVTVEEGIPALEQHLTCLQSQLASFQADIKQAEKEVYSRRGDQSVPSRSAPSTARRLQESNSNVGGLHFRNANDYSREDNVGESRRPKKVGVSKVFRPSHVSARTAGTKSRIDSFPVEKNVSRKGELWGNGNGGTSDVRARKEPDVERSGEGGSGSKEKPAAWVGIYPAWWGHREAQPRAPSPPSPVKRTSPRLAYSVQVAEKDPPIYEDDLVTAEYLRVPSSGYGQRSQPPAIRTSRAQKSHLSEDESPPKAPARGGPSPFAPDSTSRRRASSSSPVFRRHSEDSDVGPRSASKASVSWQTRGRAGSTVEAEMGSARSGWEQSLSPRRRRGDEEEEPGSHDIKTMRRGRERDLEGDNEGAHEVERVAQSRLNKGSVLSGKSDVKGSGSRDTREGSVLRDGDSKAGGLGTGGPRSEVRSGGKMERDRVERGVEGDVGNRGRGRGRGWVMEIDKKEFVRGKKAGLGVGRGEGSEAEGVDEGQKLQGGSMASLRQHSTPPPGERPRENRPAEATPNSVETAASQRGSDQAWLHGEGGANGVNTRNWQRGLRGDTPITRNATAPGTTSWRSIADRYLADAWMEGFIDGSKSLGAK